MARFRREDAIFQALTRSCALLVLLLLGAVIASLVIGAWPALGTFGFGFLTNQHWNPVTENFGGLAPIYGTLITSLIALLIAVPIGLGIAIFLTETCPPSLRRPIGIAIELLAGIPSIIYGLWGLFVPQVGDMMRVTLDEPAVFFKVTQRAYDFTTSPITVTLVLGAPD